MKNIITETKKHYVLLETDQKSFTKLLKKCFASHIDIGNITYKENRVTFCVLEHDIKKLKKIAPYTKIKKIKDMGIFSFHDFWKRNRMLFIAIFLGILAFIFLTNVIVKVEVIHSNKEIRELLEEELYDRGIKRLTIKKHYDDLQKIKKDLLEKYPDRLEWIEIEVRGMEYLVHVEERIITTPSEKKDACNIVATKDAMITKVINHKGMTLKNIDQYVRKGDIIVSGNILVDNEVKGTVCATGSAYGEVWYTIHISVPLSYEEKSYTGKVRYNWMVEHKNNPYVIFKSRVGKKEVENNKIGSLWGISLFLQKEKEYQSIMKEYTEEEALQKALELSKEKLSLKLRNDEHILTQKVLKKSTNDSTMEVDIFASVEENIGEMQEFEQKSE